MSHQFTANIGKSSLFHRSVTGIREQCPSIFRPARLLFMVICMLEVVVLGMMVLGGVIFTDLLDDDVDVEQDSDETDVDPDEQNDGTVEDENDDEEASDNDPESGCDNDVIGEDTSPSGETDDVFGTSGSDVIYADSATGSGSTVQRVFGLDGNDRIYTARDAYIDGGEGNDAIFFRDDVLSVAGVTALGGEGQDKFIAEFSDTGDTGTVNVIEDFNPDEDILCVTFHNTQDYDPATDTLTMFDHTINEISATNMAGDTLITVTMNQTVTSSTSDQISSTDTYVLAKSFLLHNLSDFDVSKVAVSANWADFLPENEIIR
jgi:hypothetical protein